MGSDEVRAVTEIIRATEKPYHRLCIGTATLGTIRMEWHQSRIGQIIPVNWSMVTINQWMGGYVPMGFLVADAQNLIVKNAVEMGFEWLLLYEDDVLPPPNAFLILSEYMAKGDVPVVSGLYSIKARPSDWLIFRGRGNGSYRDWEMGDLVWADGVPTGFVLIHMSIINAMWPDCEEYEVSGQRVRRVFDFPRERWQDPETNYLRTVMGTSDLDWCTRVKEGGYLARAGWEKYQEMEFPYLVDTNIYCRHISPSGEIFP